MNTLTNSWDIRCPNELKRMFERRIGFWYRTSREGARAIVKILSEAYGVLPPTINDTTPRRGWNGYYRPRRQTISVWPRPHIKTVFHEFYHHLDYMTLGQYDSSDDPKESRLSALADGLTGARSLAWQFAERLFNELRND